MGEEATLSLFPKKESGHGARKAADFLSSPPSPGWRQGQVHPDSSKFCVVGKSTREGCLFWNQGLVILDSGLSLFFLPLQPLCHIMRASFEGWWTLHALVTTSIALSGHCEKGKRGVLSSKDCFQLTHPPTLVTDPHRHELSLFWDQLRVSRSPKLRW